MAFTLTILGSISIIAGLLTHSLNESDDGDLPDTLEDVNVKKYSVDLNENLI